MFFNNMLQRLRRKTNQPNVPGSNALVTKPVGGRPGFIILKSFIARLREKIEVYKNQTAFKPPPSYLAELNRQAQEYVLLPVIVIAMFSWLPYIQLDKMLYPQLPLIVYLRYGFSVIGIAAKISNRSRRISYQTNIFKLFVNKKVVLITIKERFNAGNVIGFKY